MTVEAIAAVAASEDVVPAQAAQGATGAGFEHWFAQELQSVNASLGTAEQDVRALAVGRAANLHEVMIHLEEARLSFQLLAQVRNRLLEAYQEVMRTQV